MKRSCENVPGGPPSTRNALRLPKPVRRPGIHFSQDDPGVGRQIETAEETTMR